jgi:hypothetical protein
MSIEGKITLLNSSLGILVAWIIATIGKPKFLLYVTTLIVFSITIIICRKFVGRKEIKWWISNAFYPFFSIWFVFWTIFSLIIKTT